MLSSWKDAFANTPDGDLCKGKALRGKISSPVLDSLNQRFLKAIEGDGRNSEREAEFLALDAT